MTTDRVWIAGVIAVVSLGCTNYVAPRLDPGPDAPALARTGCELAERRCSRCHSIDRVLSARIGAPVQWQRYVRRMRLVPASGIAPFEERPIVACLVRLSFGAAGLSALHPEDQ